MFEKRKVEGFVTAVDWKKELVLLTWMEKKAQHPDHSVHFFTEFLLLLSEQMNL